MSRSPLVLVLGASGYVGGRLVPRLLDAGYRVRCLARSPGKLASLPWAEDADIREGDLLDPDSVEAAFDGVDVCYYLVHSMGKGAGDFASADRRAAGHAARAAERAGIARLVYLGGLGEVDDDTSSHLRSRGEVAEVLAAADVPVTVLRAAVVIGSGSASFEMLRHLVERLPAMVAPRWVDTRVQPIAIRDVLRYLQGVIADLDDTADHDYDIGGPDVLTYLGMMHQYAEVVGLPRRLVLKVPVLTPKLSSLWIGLVSPVPTGLARPLVESLSKEVVVRSGEGREDITEVVPGPCMAFEQSLRLALRRIRDHDVETSWREADIGKGGPAEPHPGDPAWSGGTLFRDERQLHAKASPEWVYRTVSRIGGDHGWPTHAWTWYLRGLADRLVGGVGLRRGRRHPDVLRPGDALDFWRVEQVRPPSTAHGGVVRLRAEMRLPGRAWLEWRIDASEEPARPGTRFTQRALFVPRGLLGRAYWWALVPFHGPIFRSMLVALAREALDEQRRALPPQ